MIHENMVLDLEPFKVAGFHAHYRERLIIFVGHFRIKTFGYHFSCAREKGLKWLERPDLAYDHVCKLGILLVETLVALLDGSKDPVVFLKLFQ